MAEGEDKPNRIRPRRELTAEESLARDLDNPFIGRMTEELRAEITARNVTQEELGEFKNRLPLRSLDADARDTLIANGRQDAAQALLLAIGTHRRQRRIEWMLGTVLVMLGYLIWRVSFGG